MSEAEPFLDRVARQLETGANRISEEQPVSPDFAEISFAVDRAVVGDYPQAELDASRDYVSDDGGLYLDRFPDVIHEPIQLFLQPSARWTNVLSSALYSAGFLLDESADAVFSRFSLGQVKRYAAQVRDSRGNDRAFRYLFIANHAQPPDLDFQSSRFYVADMLSQPLFPVEITSIEDWFAKTRLARAGGIDGCERFSKIVFQRLSFKKGRHPAAPIFGLGQLSTKMYVSAELRDAILGSGITGLELKENRRLFRG